MKMRIEKHKLLSLHPNKNMKYKNENIMNDSFHCIALHIIHRKGRQILRYSRNNEKISMKNH